VFTLNVVSFDIYLKYIIFFSDWYNLAYSKQLLDRTWNQSPTHSPIYLFNKVDSSSVIESIEIEYEMRREKMRKIFFILVWYPLYSEATHYMRGRKKTKKTYTSKLQWEFNKNNLQLLVTFDSLKYAKISQTPKTSLSALVSILGGSSGLFLDRSFMSACRAIEFFLVIIFKIWFFRKLY